MRRIRKSFGLILALVATSFVAAACGGTSSSGNQAGSNPSSSSAPQSSTGGATTSSGKTIKMGANTWPSTIAANAVWKQLLEQQGYNVKITQASLAPIFQGLSQGSLDVYLPAWIEVTQKTYWNKYKSNLVDIHKWYDNAKIGLVVPKYVTINSMAQLNANKAKFGGKIIGIEPGAGEMGVAATAIKKYPLNYKLVQGSTPAMLAALQKAINNKKWIVVTLWSPHWAFAKWQLKYLKDPKGYFGKSEGVHVIAHKGFESQFPKVTAEFKRFHMTNTQLATLESYIKASTPAAGAKKWISQNQSIVNKWLGK